MGAGRTLSPNQNHVLSQLSVVLSRVAYNSQAYVSPSCERSYKHDPRAMRLMEGGLLQLLPTMNPDGFAAHTRGNRCVAQGLGLGACDHVRTFINSVALCAGYRQQVTYCGSV